MSPDFHCTTNENRLNRFKERSRVKYQSKFFLSVDNPVNGYLTENCFPYYQLQHWEGCGM